MVLKRCSSKRFGGRANATVYNNATNKHIKVADYIDNQIKIFKKIEDLYKISRDELNEVEESLKKNIEEILDLFFKDYKLSSKNTTAVNPSKYYHIKTRVKSTISLKEKMLRKNLGLKISLNHSLDLENFDSKLDEVKSSLFLLDDIIGVRIVTELKSDCYNAYALITEKNAYFNTKKIIFSIDELTNQPEMMKNGLPIFRIKGIYKDIYGFELQIKSKIDEAWGEMDHSIFYKDYATSPIKNTVQVTMNNVGELLDKIEDLLLGLRNSENHYKEKKDEINFLNDLSENVYSEMKVKLGDNYELGKIASNLKFLKNKTKVRVKDSKVVNLNYNFINYFGKTDLHKNYIKHRNAHFELLIMEALYLYWKSKALLSSMLTEENYTDHLDLYLEYLAENMSINAKSIDGAAAQTISNKDVLEILKNYSDEFNEKSIFLDTKLIIDISTIIQIFSETYNEYVEQKDFLLENIDFKNHIQSIYIKDFLFFKNIIEFELLKNTFQDILERENIETIIFDINNKIKSRINIYQLNENENQFKSVFFLKKLSENVLSRARNYGKQ